MDTINAALRCSSSKTKKDFCPYCSGKYVDFKEIRNEKRQINIRFEQATQSQLEELREFWKNKREFNFLNKNINDIGNNIFISDANFAKFLLETAIENLSIDMENERQIDQISIWICKKRIEVKEIKKSWEDLKKYKHELWITNHKEKFENYLNKLNEHSKNDLLEQSLNNWEGFNENVFNIIWPIAIDRSHKLNDFEDQDNNELKIARLKSLYGIS